MFAEVYPLKRMPRRFTFFDYKIPEDLDVQVGDIVRAPFKRTPTLCVVRKVKETTELKRTIKITEIIEKKFLSDDDVIRLENIATSIIQSPSTVFHFALVDFKNRKGKITALNSDRNLSIGKATASFLGSVFPKLEKTCFVQMSSEGEYALASLLRKKHKGQMLILVPRERDTTYILKNLSLGDAVTINGKTSVKDRELIIKAWQSGEIKTLIGTRQSSLLPAKNLSVVHVMDCSSDDYRNLNRNPRIDARNAAEQLAKQHDATFIYSGITPRLSLLEKIPLHWQDKSQISLISLKAQEERTSVPFVSDTLQKAIDLALQSEKSVLLSFNRKGVAKQLQCSSCGYVPVCASCRNVPSVREKDLVCGVCKSEMWIPEKCPSCNLKKLSKRGLGNREMKQRIQSLYPNAKIGIIDKDIQETDADILIVTEYFFKNVWNAFYKKVFGVVADLAIDLSLSGSDFRNGEETIYKIQRLVSLASQQNAKCIIQTWLPEITKPMENVRKFLENELETRKKYSLPPVADSYKISCDESKIERKSVNKNNGQEIKLELQERPDKCIIEADLTSYDSSNSSTTSK